VWQLRINDMQPGRVLAVDLRHVLRALGRDASSATWTVSGVEADDEELFATGDGALELEALAVSGERISGNLLSDISERTHQVIWGDFRAFKDEGQSPWLRITAYDSTWYGVVCEDRAVVERIASCFEHTSITCLPDAGP